MGCIQINIGNKKNYMYTLALKSRKKRTEVYIDSYLSLCDFDLLVAATSVPESMTGSDSSPERGTWHDDLLTLPGDPAAPTGLHGLATYS